MTTAVAETNETTVKTEVNPYTVWSSKREVRWQNCRVSGIAYGLLLLAMPVVAFFFGYVTLALDK